MVTTDIPELRREPTSINIDPDLWREVKHAAIDMDVSATDFFEEALRRELARVRKEGKKKSE
jgi:predicted transcriptional regulator